MTEPSSIIQTTSLYESEAKIYPREVSGVFQRLRVIAAIILLGGYYLVPWIQWDDRQAILFDLAERKFYIFGLVMWPQDFFFLTWLLIICALSLFFFTALAGRLWCGYACPQTVWTEVFLWMERKVEGNHRQQAKLDALAWQKKWPKKTLKHALWISFALLTGFTFVGYFSPIQELSTRILSLSVGPWESFWILFYGLATYGNAGFLREQVCKYMCPYARFQSAMFDHDTLLISYDKNRGEPRGKGEAAGDCIDCGVCVQVCPTGIDIRDGLQYECIGCAACIDGCDTVMEKVNQPLGLIRYTTEHAMEGKITRILRPRVVIYALLLLVLCASFFIALSNRSPLAVDVIRDRNSLYRVIDAKTIENVYTLKIMNKSNEAKSYTIGLTQQDSMEIVKGSPTKPIAPGSVADVTLTIRAPKAELTQAIQAVELNIQEANNASVSVNEYTRFFSPR